MDVFVGRWATAMPTAARRARSLESIFTIRSIRRYRISRIFNERENVIEMEMTEIYGNSSEGRGN